MVFFAPDPSDKLHSDGFGTRFLDQILCVIKENLRYSFTFQSQMAINSSRIILEKKAKYCLSCFSLKAMGSTLGSKYSSGFGTKECERVLGLRTMFIPVSRRDL